MDEIWTQLWQLGTPFGMLGIAVVYFWRINKDQQAIIKEKDIEIASLNKYLLDYTQKGTETLLSAMNNNNIVLTSIKEAWVNQNGK